MKLPLHYYGDPVLREKAEPVQNVNDDVRNMSDDMIETMLAANGLGLAAPQVGKLLSLCVVLVPEEYDVDDMGQRLNPGISMPLVMINPEVIEQGDLRESRQEGCLSIPEVHAEVSRPSEIRVKYLDRRGVPCDERFKGLVARVIQHEVDHLNGILFIDRISHVKKIALRGKLKRMRSDTVRDLGLA